MTAEEAQNRPPKKIRDRLYPAVLKLFSENDFHQVGIRKIAEHSSLSTATIYKYFSSKENLLFSILDEKITELEESITYQILGLHSAKSIFHATLLATMSYYDRNPDLAITTFITVPYRTWMHQPEYARNYNYLHSNIIKERGMVNNELDPAIDDRHIRDLFYMICYRLVYSWYYHGMKWKLADTVNKDFELWWKMAANTGPLDNTAQKYADHPNKDVRKEAKLD